ncbi:MAG: anti-sigma factor [Gemmatimonadaceae bacterium]|nr:anti-sigma factor [Gloeobacterales cyanobacterium ES-bin-141]
MPNTPDPEFPEEMIDYVLDESPEEASAFADRLKADPQLATEVGQLRQTLEALAYSAITPPPPGARQALLKAARPVWQRLPWSRLAAVAAALVAVVLGFDNVRLRQEQQLLKEVAITLQQPNVLLLFAMQGAGTAPAARGSIAMDLDEQRAAVAIENLPSPPEGQVYLLWAAMEKGQVPCGQLRLGPTGKVTNQFPIPVGAYTSPIARLFVTLETTPDARTPSGPAVMTSL